MAYKQKINPRTGKFNIVGNGGEGGIQQVSSSDGSLIVAATQEGVDLSVVVDDEDITRNTAGELQFKNRTATDSSMGYVILRQGKTFAEQVENSQNTIFEVRYEFDMNGSTIYNCKNCHFVFKGGKIKNGFINLWDSVVRDGVFEECQLIPRSKVEIYDTYIENTNSDCIGNANYYDVSGTIIDGCTLICHNTNNKNCIKLLGSGEICSKNIIITNNKMTFHVMGIEFWGANIQNDGEHFKDILISNNKFEIPDETFNYGFAISLVAGVRNATITNNVCLEASCFVECGISSDFVISSNIVRKKNWSAGFGAIFGPVAGKCRNIYITDNIFDKMAILYTTGDNCIIKNNEVIDTEIFYNSTYTEYAEITDNYLERNIPNPNTNKACISIYNTTSATGVIRRNRINVKVDGWHAIDPRSSILIQVEDNIINMNGHNGRPIFNYQSKVGYQIKYNKEIINNVELDYPCTKGATNERPTESSLTKALVWTGFRYYDTTLDRLIIWNGTTWIEATTVTPTLTTGTKIAEVNGTELFAPDATSENTLYPVNGNISVIGSTDGGLLSIHFANVPMPFCLTYWSRKFNPSLVKVGAVLKLYITTDVTISEQTLQICAYGDPSSHVAQQYALPDMVKNKLYKFTITVTGLEETTGTISTYTVVSETIE